MGLCGLPLITKCSDASVIPTSPNAMIPTSSAPNATEVDWQFTFTGLGFGVGAGVIVAPLMFWEQGRNWFNERIDTLVWMILATFGFKYTGCGGGKVEAEESIEEEPLDDTEESDEDEDPIEDIALRGQYCVFCTKLDIHRKKAIHNPKCTCHDSPPIFSSSFSSSCSS
ncbi:unnamed protein product [Ilex paraguariensis]|uniref:Uncharacterized protein n=1 Tax=Ilex paraguariensis TaxID=185542 RepID=A0ABC8S5F9_9AQUA